MTYLSLNDMAGKWTGETRRYDLGGGESIRVAELPWGEWAWAVCGPDFGDCTHIYARGIAVSESTATGEGESAARNRIGR